MLCLHFGKEIIGSLLANAFTLETCMNLWAQMWRHRGEGKMILGRQGQGINNG
jgi:hypothetical protein